ncbi:DNA mismatch repair protein MutS [Labrys wisconsinensis]|uniref:DNA mismatch repair protein MutS n=1 Tax=Labrys wisconsinensis TaxID=425677 RepID=A0ABU0JHR6_9HYPH|nr:DNA mismatch repair protein MutS [Labrys wisconsinensis]MDQ0473827.1 DNA mismatch repair protein MutS [Labrys wisconsinensis]
MDLSPHPVPSPGEALKVTPMMEQYLEIKAANPGALLFYRMGDFYELFFGDAEIASRALGIVLTKRGKHQGDDIPMCGVPVVRAEEYLHRLIALGHRVAVCEQQEDPAEAKKRGGKSVVKRGVIRLVTPGTITEEGLLEPARANLFMTVARARVSDSEARFGLAFLDISTGLFGIGECDRQGLAAEIARIDPREIVVAEALYEDEGLAHLWRESRAAVTPVGRDVFDGASAERRLAAFYGVATVDGFGSFSRAELAAAAAAVAYVERTQIGARPALEPPRRDAALSHMAIDAATRANLELTRTLGGERAGSVLDAIDRTVTAGGGRLIAAWLSSPLTDPATIARRHDAVGWFCDDLAARTELRSRLKAAPDMARALARLTLDRGGPRDLAAMQAGLEVVAALQARLAREAALPALLIEAAEALARPDSGIAAGLAAALDDELPLMKRDGGFVRAGCDADLDETRALRDESRRVIASLQARYAEESGVRQLKVKHNNVLGYFVEVPQAAGEAFLKAPLRETYVHRQTMAGAMRFSTAELSDLESRIASAADRALAKELAIFDALAARVLADQAAIRAATEALALLDVVSALATLADEENHVRPLVDASLAFAVEGGRHPVVERALKREGKPFVANDCDLSGSDAGHIWLLTGPNMAGKSTFLRQNALIAVLAQMGAFVPARRAHIGAVDCLFSRVGAADDLARGRSTFMVEMVETAAILNQAGPRALVILDEIGRGTATFDGLSIAWAAIENLSAVNRCRSLFATHYHELTQLAKTLPRLANATMRVTEWQGDVVFLHEVAPGAADRSYGIQVAKLAGMPAPVVERARKILAELESADRTKTPARLIDDLPLFAVAPRPAPAAPRRDEVAEALDGLDPDDMTPRQALEALFELKARREAARKRPGP